MTTKKMKTKKITTKTISMRTTTTRTTTKWTTTILTTTALTWSDMPSALGLVHYHSPVLTIVTIIHFHNLTECTIVLWTPFFSFSDADGGFLLCPAPQILFYFLLLWTWYGQNSMQLNSTQCTSEFHVIGISTFYFGFPPTSFTPFNERNPIKSYLIS